MSIQSRKTISAPAGKGWIHFAIAAVVLGGSAVAFQFSAYLLGWALQKEPVPWPEGVVVDPESFRMGNFPDSLDNGRYVLAADGELTGKKDGLPDGDMLLTPDDLDALGIGNTWDKQRIADRQSNWYLIRIYRDETRPPGDPLRYWRLEVYYYTGARDTVPHVPERCMAESGAMLVGSADMPVSVPAASKGWDEGLSVKRALFEMTDKARGTTSRLVQYYVFSLNGKAETDWEKVRFTLVRPTIKYCYFAKIQIAPMGQVASEELADAAAADFANAFLPMVVRALPSSRDVETLKAAHDGK
jgi:hypothetical protein